MDEVKIIELKKTIMMDNDADAAILRDELKKEKTFYVNVMSSPGSGKTTTIVQTIRRLKHELAIGVIEADIDSDVDAITVKNEGVKAIQVHTGGMCHLDADMSRQGLKELETDDLDMVMLENVGNLVCPAEFDTGSCINVVILSVPEGHDKPLKYPLMFQQCDVVLINKIDVMPVFDFDMDAVKKYIHLRNSDAKIFPISAETGQGMDAWCDWLKTQAKFWLE
jgi:hydrogenase nickel incorporation protein HypB